MDGRRVVQDPVGAPAGRAPFILLAETASETERVLLARWLRDSGLRPSVIIPLNGPGLARSLAGTPPDTMVTAARVAWLLREPGDEGQVRWPEPLSLAIPRRPPPFQQARIARSQPGRARVVLAEPATVAALRARWGGTGSFEQFVALQARLALERAERPLRGYRYKVPKHVVEAIQDSPQFRREVSELSARLDVPEPDVTELARTDLESLAASVSPLAVDLLSAALRPLHARAWEVQADTAGLERLRELNRRHALVFLPSHRSYADSLLLADVLTGNDFPRNHVISGDNLSFWPIGPLARRAGVIFIRRSFGGDEVYKFALRAYLGYLLAKRFNLEWYLEGGRSRTGKLRPPRYGLLTYLAEAIERGYAQDACLVPVSITYDQLAEASAMAAEQSGRAKKAEGLTWLASYARGQLNRIGTAAVRFAEPLSLREAMAAEQSGRAKKAEGLTWLASYARGQLNRIGTAAVRFAEPLSLREAMAADGDAGDRDAWRLRLQKVAFEVAVRINRVTPATATAMVTLALLGVRDRALTLGQVRRVLEPLRDYLAERGLPRTDDALRTGEGVCRVLGALARQRVVTIYDGGVEPVYAIEQGQHLVAAFYRNSAIHHFVDRSVAELVLLSPAADRFDEAMRLRDQLKFEFFFPDKQAYRAQLSAELGRLDPGWESADGRTVLERSRLLMAHRVLRSFLDAQLVVAERLSAHDPARPVEEKEFLAECGGVGQQMLLQGRLHGPESLSRELFSGALRLAANQDLTGPGDAELARRRQAFAARLRDVVARVITIDEIDAASRREVAGVEP
jgi:glycerol-3-phosphate O-acyltransferase